MCIRLTDHNPSPKAQSRCLRNAHASFAFLQRRAIPAYCLFLQSYFYIYKGMSSPAKKDAARQEFLPPDGVVRIFSFGPAVYQSRSLHTIGQIRAHTAPLSRCLFDCVFAGSSLIHALNVPGFRIGDVVHLIVCDRHLKILFGFGELFDLLIDAVRTI